MTQYLEGKALQNATAIGLTRHFPKDDKLRFKRLNFPKIRWAKQDNFSIITVALDCVAKTR